MYADVFSPHSFQWKNGLPELQYLKRAVFLHPFSYTIGLIIPIYKYYIGYEKILYCVSFGLLKGDIYIMEIIDQLFLAIFSRI